MVPDKKVIVDRSFEFIYEADYGVVDDILGITFLGEMTLRW